MIATLEADATAQSAPVSTDHDTTPTMQDMPGMELSGHDAHAGYAMMMGALGAYPASRDASGTSWQPDSAPHEGLHGQIDGWQSMLHGYATAIYDDQGGRRGATKSFVQSHVMGIAQHTVGEDTLTLHSAFSLDPLMGKAGYPLLLQTGETADGTNPLIDRQHPHNFFSELGVIYAHPLEARTETFIYVGYPGEPALGPATYLHRFAGMANPETPIDHHWMDSTHITFGVATVGVTRGPLKLEVSDFTGREPDQYRWGFNEPRFDSWSTRLTLNPTPDWSMQASYGALHSPEQLTPAANQKRTTASATYNRRLDRGNWQTTFAWGLDRNSPGHALNAYLLESAVQVGSNTLFARVENVDKDELFTGAGAFNGRVFNVTKLSVGYFRTVDVEQDLALDLGALISKYALPSPLDASYGADPTSFMVFARIKID